jgi:hypothetical protein
MPTAAWASAKHEGSGLFAFIKAKRRIINKPALSRC